MLYYFTYFLNYLHIIVKQFMKFVLINIFVLKEFIYFIVVIFNLNQNNIHLEYRLLFVLSII